ncbi:MAG: hypothetical protein OEL57_15675 [Trichlorobacter sp.]|uniref:hypothetical protein n=1 Tax=Trichlorobacter sp. TaxID=2911007 RepID=UPI002567DB32|nr:hypothetical protein [Trichlorobacter sp.]MDK9719321.1 hypothetical protein [Trichlorobacter sp.]
MPPPSLHTSMRPLRRGIAALMATIYLLIGVGPLTSLALQPLHHAHDGRPACSGDCKRDGCSLQSQLNHTCCCWKKKQQENHLSEPAAATADCCHTTLPAETVKAVLEETITTQPSVLPEPQAAQTVLTCGCPCDDSSQTALFNSHGNEIIPFFHRVVIVPPEEPPYRLSPGSTLHSLSSKPLVPPPKPV